MCLQQVTVNRRSFKLQPSPRPITIPVCGVYGGLYPNLSRRNFLGPNFFRNKFPFPKKGTTPRRTWYTKNRESFLGPWGQTSLDKVPVAKFLFIPLQVSNKLGSEKLHAFLWLQPQCRCIFFHGTTPQL